MVYRVAVLFIAISSILTAQEQYAPILPARGDFPAQIEQYANSVTTAAFAAPSSACNEIENGCVAPGWWGTADLLMWRAHMRSLDYAATEDGTSLTVGVGENHRVNYDRSAGLRTEVGYMTKVGWGVSVGYTHFSADGANAVSRPPGIGQLFSTISHPGGPEEADQASAFTSLDFRLLEFAGRTTVLDERYRSVDLIAGVRWASIDQELIAEYDGRDFVSGQIVDNMEVDAVGLFVGGETHWRLAKGWSVFGRGALGVLYGRMQNTRLETNLNQFEQLVDFRDEYTEPVFNFDARIGVGKQIGVMSLRAGYDLNLWTDVGDGFRFTDDIEESTSSTASGDLLLEGAFLQAAINW